jgi:hypothetical protein
MRSLTFVRGREHQGTPPPALPEWEGESEIRRMDFVAP